MSSIGVRACTDAAQPRDGDRGDSHARRRLHIVLVAIDEHDDINRDDINRDDIRRDNSERGKIKRDDIKRDDIKRDDRGVSTAPNCRRAVHRPVSCIARHRTRRVDLHGEPHARSGLA